VAKTLAERRKSARERYHQRKNENPAYYKNKAKTWSLKKNYGITLSQWEALVSDQNGLCAICSRLLALDGLGKCSAVVDHDHRTGRIRGILCNTCNSGLGHLQDSLALVEQAASYLRKHNAQ
jgi:hypothetical protein